MQEPQQCIFVDRQFLQRMAVDSGYYPGDEPARLTHLYHRNQRCVLTECSEGSAEVVRLSHGAPMVCHRRVKVACPCRALHSIYKRNGTTTLFAALNMLDGTVIGACMPRHRHREFLRFLKLIDQQTPAGLDLHLIVDNYATHKTPAVKRWIKLHPRFQLHFTPTSASWLNMVERFFAEITRKRIRRGAFKSVAELKDAIIEYLENHNADPKPFIWTKSAGQILEKVARAKQALKSQH